MITTTATTTTTATMTTTTTAVPTKKNKLSYLLNDKDAKGFNPTPFVSAPRTSSHPFSAPFNQRTSLNPSLAPFNRRTSLNPSPAPFPRTSLNPSTAPFPRTSSNPFSAIPQHNNQDPYSAHPSSSSIPVPQCNNQDPYFAHPFNPSSSSTSFALAPQRNNQYYAINIDTATAGTPSNIKRAKNRQASARLRIRKKTQEQEKQEELQKNYCALLQQYEGVVRKLEASDAECRRLREILYSSKYI